MMTIVGPAQMAYQGASTQTMVTASPFRIAYFDYLLADGEAGWDRWMGHLAGLGFTQILIPPPFTPAGNRDRFLPSAFNELHPHLHWAGSLRNLAQSAQRHGLILLIDLVLDRVSADAEEAGPFQPISADAPLLDPRHNPHDRYIAQANVIDIPSAKSLAAWWNAWLDGWNGVAGLRLLGLERLGGTMLAELLRDIRAANPELLLLGWTPGLSRDRLTGLQGTGLNGVFGSLPWWDWRSDWLWDEARSLRQIAPLIWMPAAPMYGMPANPGGIRRALNAAALLGSGWMMPAGLEAGLAPHGDAPTIQEPGSASDLTAHISLLNSVLATRCGPDIETRPLPGSGDVLALLRQPYGQQADIIIVNTDADRAHRLDTMSLLSGIGGTFSLPHAVIPAHAPALVPGTSLTLAPGEARLYRADAISTLDAGQALSRDAARQAASAPRIGIEAVTPNVDGGRFPVKRIAGEAVSVEADVICDGHDQIGVALLWRPVGNETWQEKRMRPLGNDRWQAVFPLIELGRYQFTIEAWRDEYATFRDDLSKKCAAGLSVDLEIQEGIALVEQAATRSANLKTIAADLRVSNSTRQLDILFAENTMALMQQADERPFGVRVNPPLAIDAERSAANYASWYEVFPRSLSDDPNRHGTLRDVIRHLPRIQAMGFDVLYFPPIHPIGHTNRKGRNNSLQAGPDDPGSPYAIGGSEGGHDALHPQLGGLDDFQALRVAAAAHGMELALDFAVQCSPDHPWIKDHPNWFAHRPDGSIRYAENPPKKYEDIVNVDFYAPDAIPELWMALCDAVLFWARQGVRLFRVDNPHTKPLPFWQWLIAEVRERFPDTVFLAEAFTRPKVMYRLAKIGFSQSYTYFTWRNSKQELQEYLTELTTTAPRDFFRPHFFVNTPDINPTFLHDSGRSGFLIRAALAATLSGLWGVYNGFELCEATPLKPGKEEYLDSEKYQLRAWDWDRPGNIVTEIAQLNRIRRDNPALQTHLGVTFLPASNDRILYYEKALEDRSNVVLIAINLDPKSAQDTNLELPLWRWNMADDTALDADNLLTGEKFTWQGKKQFVHLTAEQPYAIWRVRPAT